jgi:hypothetical protein
VVENDMSRWTWLGGRLLPRASALAGASAIDDWLYFASTRTTSLADRFVLDTFNVGNFLLCMV